MMTIPKERPAKITLHHLMGEMDVLVDYDMADGQFVHKSAGLVRTARKLAQGDLFVPA
jgi:2-methylaconitate cis-trans-isomerase PrpF